jgi:predicted lipoprotein with Yx(FWY)xxD motif
MRAGALLLLAFAVPAMPALAQPVDLPVPPATTDVYPPGVSVRRIGAGSVYVDRKGRTLYGMDMRTLMRFGPDPAQHCVDACAAAWAPLLAPADAVVNIRYPQGFGDRGREGSANTQFVQNQKAPDWTVIDGPAGKQWVYKGWHMVFARIGDRPGSTAFDGAEDLTWNTLKFVPPMPKVEAPAGAAPIVVDGRWVLADKAGRVLFTGTCKDGCTGWRPLTGGMASRPLGDWSVAPDQDIPQWRWRGKPVWMTVAGDPVQVPPGAKELRP